MNFLSEGLLFEGAFGTTNEVKSIIYFTKNILKEFKILPFEVVVASATELVILPEASANALAT